ncbi:MAG: hypothetical protein ACRDKS_08475 [Actinomycetota bacterium]
MSRGRAAAFLVTLLLLTAPRIAPAAGVGCATPGKSWTRTLPANVAMDSHKLQGAMDWATRHASSRCSSFDTAASPARRAWTRSPPRRPSTGGA